MKIRQGMTSGEYVENKWFNMKYIGKYLSVEILLTHECTVWDKFSENGKYIFQNFLTYILWQAMIGNYFSYILLYIAIITTVWDKFSENGKYIFQNLSCLYFDILCQAMIIQ